MTHRIPPLTFTRRQAMLALGAAALMPAPHLLASRQDVDAEAQPFPAFSEDPAIQGVVRCVGSSAVGLVLNAVRPGFRESQPDIGVEMISSGSSSGPRALAAGQCDLAPMSRAMRRAEIEEVEKARKGTVDWIDIAIDAIAVNVHVKNPLTRIGMVDLDRVFGRERRRGGAPAVKWTDIGVRDPAFTDGTITLFGMGSGTGSNGIVQEVVLLGGPFRTTVNEEPVSSSIVQAVATDPLAIGYGSVLFESVRVRKLEIECVDAEGKPTGTFVAPTDDSIRSGRYPLSRALRLYFVREEIAARPAARKFLQFLLSQDGQEIIGDLGQKTLAPKDAHAMTAKVR